jgi:hypothetical protein
MTRAKDLRVDFADVAVALAAAAAAGALLTTFALVFLCVGQQRLARAGAGPMEFATSLAR